MAAVEIHELSIRYGEVTAVDRVSFSAEGGAVTAVLGPNGAGKTSTIETAEGYRSASAGSVRVCGLDPIGDHRELCRRIGVMLQRGGVYPTMRPGEAIQLFASYYEEAEDPSVLLERLGLWEVRGTPWRRLSGGEQQRLSLALAIVGKPDVVFLDEPTAGVDPGGRMVIREVVRELRDRGAAVLLTTHELEEAERVADRVVIMDRGRVVAAGTPAELMASGRGQEIRFAAPEGVDTTSLGERLGASVTEASPGQYVVDLPSTPSAVATLTAWLAERDVPLGDLRAGRETLEDVFMRLTGASTAELERAPRTGRSTLGHKRDPTPDGGRPA